MESSFGPSLEPWFDLIRKIPSVLIQCAEPSEVSGRIGEGKGVPRCASSHGLVTPWPASH